MSIYTPTIGLEVHAELRTKTKMFCDSKNDPDEKQPNLNICPVCTAHPGTLPSINKEAVKHILKVGIALGGELAKYSEFDRKNYFYPDIPKGYQISQYKYPLVRGGLLNNVSITRVHLEEDTARSSHEGERTLVDFNRAGVPLMELVTEPSIRSAGEAVSFAKELQLLLKTLRVSEANMEKGEMRVEANVSVGKEGELGKKVEIKNLNSFRIVGRAIQYEIERQTKILKDGGIIIQETRGWDDQKNETFSQRIKEESHDYRYFPDPDLPKINVEFIPEFSIANLSKELPELPSNKRVRYENLGLKKEDVEVLVWDENFSNFFDEVTSGEEKDFIQKAINYLTSDILGLVSSQEIKNIELLKATEFKKIIHMFLDKKLSSRGVKDAIKYLLKNGGEAVSVVEELGLAQVSGEDSLEALVQEIIDKNQRVVDEYKSGKTNSIQYLVGEGMKDSKGAANPTILKEIFKRKLG